MIGASAAALSPATSTASIHKLSARATVSRDRARAAVAEIEQARARRRLSHDALCQKAGITAAHWRRIRSGERHPSPRVLRQLMRAVTLAELAPRDPMLVEQLAFEGLQNRVGKLWRAGMAGNARDIAITIAHVGLGWPQARIARLIGVTGQRIQAIISRMEDLREDDSALNALLDRMEEACSP